MERNPRQLKAIASSDDNVFVALSFRDLGSVINKIRPAVKCEESGEKFGIYMYTRSVYHHHLIVMFILDRRPRYYHHHHHCIVITLLSSSDR